MPQLEKNKIEIEIKTNKKEEKKMTEEQHEVVQKVCKFVHKIKSDTRPFFCDEFPDHCELWKCLIADNDDSINNLLTSVGLDRITYIDTYDWIALPTDSTSIEDGEDLNENYDIVNDVIIDLIFEIKKYLQIIDDEYGTSYVSKI